MVTSPIMVGDIVTRTGDTRLWWVVDVYPDLGFARLEFTGEAWVKSATESIGSLVLSPWSHSKDQGPEGLRTKD